jgi:predicted component of type VI protein secretion system
MQFHAHTDADAHASGTPRLVCIGGSHHGHSVAIPPGGLSIGRARDNLLIIVDGSISAHHAWIGIVDGGVMLRDYQSLAGTFLNADLNTRVGDALLADGDTIHFGGEGGEEFRLVIE